MGILKCKMCGGTLEVNNETVAVCDFCGTHQTVPTAKDENLQGLFNRANILRMKSEFDKAEQIYEKIIQTDAAQAEAYWGLILCKFGIEYVEDPKTFKRVPTCHRTSYDSIIADDDYRSALQYADTTQRSIYEAEAKEIDRLQKEIIALSLKEEPYDVFICYKETDSAGKRTQDSVIANDIYFYLTNEGFKVFYAPITLEDKLGSAYEPCIFAALNSARVMLAIGTRAEYFSAVWVKNEWSRFLKIIKNDRSKMLIPCYKDMDAYELPEEFSHLQAQDMSKIGFINDIVRGLKKFMAPKQEEKPVITPQAAEILSPNVNAILDRGFMALEDGDWSGADGLFEQALNFDARLSYAYLGKLMAQLRVRKVEELKKLKEPIDSYKNYQKAVRFADEKLRETLEGYVEYIFERKEKERIKNTYDSAVEVMACADTEGRYVRAAELFESVSEYRDSASLAKTCREKAESIRKDGIFNEASRLMTCPGISGYMKAIELFEMIPGWLEADEKAKLCREKVEEFKAKVEAERLEKQRLAEYAKEKAKKRAEFAKKVAIVVLPIACVIIAFIIVLNVLIIPSIKYNSAIELADEGKYSEAVAKLQDLGDYSDSKDRLFTLWEKIAVRDTVSAGGDHTVGIRSDGTVVAVGSYDDGQCSVSGWTDILAISAGRSHTVGLKSDGTVVAVGSNDDGQCNVSGWTDIVAISAGFLHTVGLRADGTVVAVGQNYFKQCNVSEWTDIVAISAGGSFTVGLKSDGTVVAVGSNDDRKCDVSEWTDIVAISTGYSHTVGLRADGTVVATGYGDKECDVSEWTDIVSVEAGNFHTVGLRSNGTVVAVGSDKYPCYDVSEWENIVAISAGYFQTVGLRADGTVVAVGNNDDGQCVVSEWTDIRIPAAKEG